VTSEEYTGIEFTVNDVFAFPQEVIVEVIDRLLLK
jgi:hypothetical protein